MEVEVNTLDRWMLGGCMLTFTMETASFHENYAELHFDAKYLENRLNRGW